MNNSFKRRDIKEVKIQLKRAEVKKNILIKNIYKEYEIYFNIVRKSIFPSSERGIFGLYSELFISDKSLNKGEFNNFLNHNIRLIINSKLPLLTIEQLNLEHISDTSKQFVNAKALKEFLEFNENQSVDFDYENELINKESFEFHCNNNLNSYDYYEFHSEDESSSINLDENGLNSFPKLNIIKNIKYEKDIVDNVLEIIDEILPIKINQDENIIDPINDVFISRDNLNFFENIDKSFKHFLLNLSYEINSELFKKNLIKKFITEDIFKYLTNNNNNLIKYPNPFVIKYDLNPNGLSEVINKYSDIYLFNISNIELEFYNFDLSNCRNNINELKNKFRLLNKKHLYWKSKEFNSKHIN